MKTVKVLLCCLLCLLAHGVRGADEECTLMSDTCACTAPDGTTLDISKYLHWPVSKIPSGGYTYEYGPCAPLLCGDTESKNFHVHACQYGAKDHYALSEGIDKWTIHSMSPLEFTILYHGHRDAGGTTRTTSVKFTYSDAATAIAFDHDDSTHTYYFTVTGKGVTTGGGGGGGGGSHHKDSSTLSSVEWVLVAVFAAILLISAMIMCCVAGGLIVYFCRRRVEYSNLV